MESVLIDSEEQKPTPDNGDASTLDPLDRIEQMLRAGDGPGEEEPAQGSDVKPDGDGQQEQETLTPSDLARLLKLEDNALDLDEDGSVRFRTKVDGVEGTAKLQDLIASYQLQAHVDRKSREAAEREKAFQAKQQEAEAQLVQRVQYAEGLANVAAQQLLAEFQSIDWRTLEAQDPGTAALYKQKFQERQAQLRGVYHNIQQEKATQAQKSQAEMQATLEREAQRLPTLIPEWKDAQVAQKERAEIRDWAIKAGYEPSEIDSISKAHHVAVLRKAMLADRLHAHKAEVENKVRKAPVLVKPGQPSAQSAKEATVQKLHQTVRKTGGKNGAIEALLIAKGLV